MSSVKVGDLPESFARARTAFEAKSPSSQAHERHLQRLSFAYGNVALSYKGLEQDREAFETKLRESIRAIAGPCPCTRCAVLHGLL